MGCSKTDSDTLYEEKEDVLEETEMAFEMCEREWGGQVSGDRIPQRK